MKKFKQSSSLVDQELGPVRGVVLSVQLPDVGSAAQPTASVLVYDASGQLYGSVLHQVLITFNSMHVHDGVMSLPKATTNLPADLTTVDPFSLDGSHVIVDFLQRARRPFISRYLWHPYADYQKNAEPFEQRVRPRAGDLDSGAPLPIATVKGVRVYLSATGELVVDTRGSRPDFAGKEDTPDSSTSAGPVKIITRPDAQVTIDGGPVQINSNGTVQVSASSSVQIDSSDVNVGIGATHPAVHGDSLSVAHLAFDTALASVLDSMATAIKATLALLPPTTSQPIQQDLDAKRLAADAGGLKLASNSLNSTVVKLA